MPGPKTHEIFYKQLKNRLHPEILKKLPDYDTYSIFAQGHDIWIYHNFYKIWRQSQLYRNISVSVLLQEQKFQEFVYCFLKNAEKRNALSDEQFRLFVAGYVTHHILDAYTHPLIIYYAGDHVRDTSNTTWRHGIAENLLDIYLMEKIENRDVFSYPAHKDFKFNRKIIKADFIAVLEESLQKTYGITGGAQVFYESVSQIKSYMKIFKVDALGMKQLLFDAADPFLKGTAAFSYHRDSKGVYEFLNESHEEWLNPLDAGIRSKDSFMDLFEKALQHSTNIIEQLLGMCESGMIKQSQVFEIVPDVASTYGLKCGLEFRIKNRKYEGCF